jgi:hypothetical protein
VERQAVEVSLNTHAKKLQENLEVITTDLTMVDIEVKTSNASWKKKLKPTDGSQGSTGRSKGPC